MNQLNEKDMPDVSCADNQLTSEGMPQPSEVTTQTQEDMNKML